jgi:hypothetical protein
MQLELDCLISQESINDMILWTKVECGTQLQSDMIWERIRVQ